MKESELNKIIDDYFENFKLERKEELLKNVNYEDLLKLKKGKIISTLKTIVRFSPSIGRNSSRYWLERGWDTKEAKIKSKETAPKRNPESSPMNVNFWINRGLSISEAEYKIKSQRKTNIEYWLEKGLSLEDSEKELSVFQKQNCDFRLYKENNGLLTINYNTKIEYFLNQGFTEEESKIKLSERQTTFSKEKCIKKHGEEEGLIIWQERQNKWQKTLSENYIEHSNKNCKTVDFFIKKYGDNWFRESINNLTLSDDIKYTLLNNFDEDNIEVIIKYYIDNYFHKSTLGLYHFCKKFCLIKIIQYKFNLDFFGLFALFFKILDNNIIIRNTFGKICYYEGYILKSMSELTILKFLLNNNINFVYEPPYPYTKKRFDFYITDINLHVEYIGMIKCSNLKIRSKYEENIKIKKDICLEYNINCLFESDVKEIIKHIKYEIENKNR